MAERYLLIEQGGQQIALSVADVVEVLNRPCISHLPHTPQALMGVAAWRGRTVPVIDPSAVLKQEGFPSECTNRAVVLQREAPFAIPVDRVGEMVSERQIRSLALAPLDVARLSQLLTDDPVIHPEGDNW